LQATYYNLAAPINSTLWVNDDDESKSVVLM